MNIVTYSQVKLIIKTVESYKKILKYFDSNKIYYYTKQLKSECCYRVVQKGLHFSTAVSEIKAELLSLGHQVRNLINVRSQVTKQPLSMFFVDYFQAQAIKRCTKFSTLITLLLL